MTLRFFSMNSKIFLLVRNSEKDNVKKNDADMILILPGCWLTCRLSGGGGSCHLSYRLPWQEGVKGGEFQMLLSAAPT
jgi:hypothetical protein